MTFSVDTELYSGPLELLLHLVRREELPLAEISLHVLSEQYLAYLEILTVLDLDDVAEFLEIASILIEMKAKQALPTVEAAAADDEQAIEDPSDQLVQRLIDYKRIRDAASLLDENSRRWQLRYARLANDLPPRRLDPGTQPIESIEVWDLVSVSVGYCASAKLHRSRASSTTTRRSMSTCNTSISGSRPIRESNSADCSSLACTKAHWWLCS